MRKHIETPSKAAFGAVFEGVILFSQSCQANSIRFIRIAVPRWDPAGPLCWPDNIKRILDIVIKVQLNIVKIGKRKKKKNEYTNYRNNLRTARNQQRSLGIRTEDRRETKRTF